MVCKDHVTKGLHELSAPHVKQIPKKEKNAVYSVMDKHHINCLL